MESLFAVGSALSRKKEARKILGDGVVGLPELQLRTVFGLGGEGRIVGTRAAETGTGPLLALIRGRERCAWAGLR